MKKFLVNAWKVVAFLATILWEIIVAIVMSSWRRKAQVIVLAACFYAIWITVDIPGAVAELKNFTVRFVRENQTWAPWVIGVLVLLESIAGISFFFPAMFVLIGLAPVIMGSGVETTTMIYVGLAAWLATGFGDWISFWIGRAYGKRLLGIWPFNAHPEEVQTGMRFAARWGSWAVWIARIFGPARAFAIVALGMAHMPWLRFQFHNWVSGAVLVGGLGAVGYGRANGSELAKTIAHWFFG